MGEPLIWLAVCTGNTCRSPLLMHLLNYRLHQLGRSHTVAVRSAGLPSHADGTMVVHKRQPLPFAIEGLRTAARWLELRHGTLGALTSFVDAASQYRSRSIDEVDGAECERVVRIIAMEKRHAEEVSARTPLWRADMRVLDVKDDAYRIFEDAKRPLTVKEDADGAVFVAYQCLALKLAWHAETICDSFS